MQRVRGAIFSCEHFATRIAIMKSLKTLLILTTVSCYHTFAQNTATTTASSPSPVTTLAPASTSEPMLMPGDGSGYEATPSPLPTPTPVPTSMLGAPTSMLLPTPTPVSTDGCVFVNFSCQGLSTTNRSFSLFEICEPLLRQEIAGTCSFIISGGLPVGFKCPNIFGLQTALLCIPPDIPQNTDYCFCPELPSIKISGVPDIQFIGNASNITENDGILTVCAVAGQLVQEFTPLNVVISTSSGVAKAGVDFENFNQELSFDQSNQMHCVDITILKDGVDEVDEYFLVNLVLKYAPFDIPLDTYNATIIDSDIIGVSFEQRVYFTTESAGSVTICAITNVTLNGTQITTIVLETEDVTAQAGSDYTAVGEVRPFPINGDNHVCIDVPIIQDEIIQMEYYELFLVQLTSSDAPVIVPQAVVVILDQDQLYPFGDAVGDAAVPSGIAADATSPPLTLSPTFRFFGMNEDTLYVNTNGVLTFDERFRGILPRPFPDNSLQKISPYWENFDTSRSGRIYYRNTTDITLLRRAQFSLRDIFPSARDFFPSYLFIATWDDAQELGLTGDTSLDNTFQVVMATDGNRSFVFFTYIDIQWGEGGVGFDAGDHRRGFNFIGSRTGATRNLEEFSNVGVEGVYAFRVDLQNILSPGDCGGQVGVIRLFNGSSVSDGKVEYCLDSTWTPVCGDDWEESEAAVACRQLGFAGEGATVSFKAMRQPTHLSTEFNCTGTENNLLECTGGGNTTVAQSLLGLATNSCQYLAVVNCTPVQIGFQQGSYTVLETDESVRVCVQMTTGNYTVSVTRAVLYTGSAQNGTDYSISIDDSTTEFLFEGAPQQECIEISILDDEIVEQSESFLVIVNTTLTSHTVSLNPQYAFVTIIDDDRPVVPPGVIAGSVVAATAVLLCVGGIIFAYLFYRRRKHIVAVKKMREMELLREQLKKGNTYITHEGMVVTNPLVKDVPKDMIIPSLSLRLLDPVGQGEFGIVYKAHYVKTMQAMPTFVAVKTLKGFYDLDRISELMRECVKMMEFDNPHVLSLIGVCLDAGPAPYIVLPFMANGNLLAYVKKEKKNLVFPDHSMADSEQAITARKRMADMCLQIAKGMEYLASKRIVHRDLAARNCMIDAHFIIKVSDFGLSESVYTQTYFRQTKKSTGVKLPVKWLSPEALTEGVFSEKSDVWAYGVTCWEVFTGGRIPYPGVDPFSLPSLLENGLKLEKPKNAACSEELYFFMFRCWHTDPEERQTFSELVRIMSQTLLTMADYLDVSTFGELEETAKEEAAKEEEASKEETAKEDEAKEGAGEEETAEEETAKEEVAKEKATDQDAIELNSKGDAFGNDDDRAMIIEEAKL